MSEMRPQLTLRAGAVMQMKQRWQLAEQVAQKMGVTKSDGYNLIPVLTNHGLLERVLNNDAEAIQAALKLDWFGKPNPDLENRANGIGIMIWAIRKCGSIEVARDAFNKAARVLADKK
jgi:hypothetical protein